jgi:hypothetical protein
MQLSIAFLALLAGTSQQAVADSAPGAPIANGQAEVDRTPHFVFYSSELFNLHQFLYQCAKTLDRRERMRTARGAVEVLEMDAVDGLQGDERATWFAALEFYRSDVIARDLLFDGDMYALKHQLASIDDPDGDWNWPVELDASYEHALRAALPVYRARFWKQHDGGNREWTASAVKGLARYEASLVERMTSAYGGEWPDEPMRVDVCAYANWAGAYTTGGPPHITLASTDAESQGHAALEVLVHEASHTRELFSGLRGELFAAYETAGREPPSDLWHLFIFLTAGDSVERVLAADGVDHYAHYGDRTGLYLRANWAQLYPRVQPAWSAYLAAEIERAVALERIVGETN